LQNNPFAALVANEEDEDNKEVEYDTGSVEDRARCKQNPTLSETLEVPK
jgi:hypothetical protein